MAVGRRTRRQRLGHAAELAARKLLEQAGLKTISRNFNSRFGEIDLIMRDGNTLVFVEVRYRQSSAYGGARASVDRTKQSKLLRAAEIYLLNNPELRPLPMRFDVVAFESERDAQWIKRAFFADQF